MSLDEELVKAATGVYAITLGGITASVGAAISYYLEHLPEPTLPERMREAAKTHRAVAARDRKGGFVSIAATRWSADDLDEYADKWEADDRDQSEQEMLAEELAQDLALAECPGSNWPEDFEVDVRISQARKLIASGWRREVSGG